MSQNISSHGSDQVCPKTLFCTTVLFNQICEEWIFTDWSLMDGNKKFRREIYYLAIYCDAKTWFSHTYWLKLNAAPGHKHMVDSFRRVQLIQIYIHHSIIYLNGNNFRARITTHFPTSLSKSSISIRNYIHILWRCIFLSILHLTSCLR